MRRKRNKKRRIVTVISIIVLFNIILIAFLMSIKPVVVSYAQSVAKRILLNCANEAVVNIIEENDISYDDIAVISKDSDGKVTSLEINTATVNLIKGKISLEISEIIARAENYSIYIPIGTFLGNEFTNGLGPRVKFTMQISSNAVTDFSYDFIDAGINQAVHRVILNIELTGNLIMKGITDRFTVSTTAILAETVIVGLTPDAFTEVIEAPYNDLADTLTDYGAVQ